MSVNAVVTGRVLTLTVAIPLTVDGDGNPMLRIFDTCVDLIRTLPLLQHDDSNIEDMAEREDHLADALRYGALAKPWRPAPPSPVDDDDIETRDRYVRAAMRNRRRPWSGSGRAA